jgi:hypothetical protein
MEIKIEASNTTSKKDEINATMAMTLDEDDDFD